MENCQSSPHYFPSPWSKLISMGSVTRGLRLWRRQRCVKCREGTQKGTPRAPDTASVFAQHTHTHRFKRVKHWIAVSRLRLLNTANPSKMQQVARVKCLMKRSVRRCALNNDIELPNEPQSQIWRDPNNADKCRSWLWERLQLQLRLRSSHVIRQTLKCWCCFDITTSLSTLDLCLCLCLALTAAA